MSVCCIHPLNAFHRDIDGSLFLKVCSQHSRVIPSESYAALATRDERLRSVTQLQQKAKVLEIETARRKEAEMSLHIREMELKKSLAQLAEEDRRKNEFLSILGHELRNPLSAVMNAIAAADLNESRRERALDIARRQTGQLARLADDLLDTTRITQGRIALQREVVQIRSIVECVVEEDRSLLQSQRQELVVSFSPEAATVQVDADPARLQQVVDNLINNATKFTPPAGRIEVLVQLEHNEVVLRIRDSGIGISPEMLPCVFDLFAQADHSLDRAQGGLGIGLTLVKGLVEMHGGRVQARSDGPGKGSEFEVRLPALSKSYQPASAIGRAPAASGHANVLIVEDNADAAESLKMLLEVLGHVAQVAADGPAALEAVSAGDFDAVLVDIGLPGIDGYEVARRIRMLPNARTMLVAALTGYGLEEDRRRARSAGFDLHLVKPVKIEYLGSFLARVTAQPQVSDRGGEAH